MKPCCAEKIIEMQEEIQAGKWLKLLLAASPFILIIPSLDPTTDIDGARDFIIEEIIKISVDKAKSSLGKAVTLPDFADACQAADCFTVNALAQKASSHAIRHPPGSPEFLIWMKMAESYTNAVAGGQCAAPAGGWLPWNW